MGSAVGSSGSGDGWTSENLLPPAMSVGDRVTFGTYPSREYEVTFAAEDVDGLWSYKIRPTGFYIHNPWPGWYIRSRRDTGWRYGHV